MHSKNKSPSVDALRLPSEMACFDELTISSNQQLVAMVFSSKAALQGCSTPAHERGYRYEEL